jgi:hypothetical protein
MVVIGWSFSDGNSGAQGAGGARQAIGSITVRSSHPSRGCLVEPSLEP